LIRAKSLFKVLGLIVGGIALMNSHPTAAAYTLTFTVPGGTGCDGGDKCHTGVATPFWAFQGVQWYSTTTCTYLADGTLLLGPAPTCVYSDTSSGWLGGCCSVYDMTPKCPVAAACATKEAPITIE
jgi:hypothetical protein